MNVINNEEVIRLFDIGIPLSLFDGIQKELDKCIFEFERNSRRKPQYLSLNRVAYGALKAWSRTIQQYTCGLDMSEDIMQYKGMDIICIPSQVEFVKALGNADFEFYYGQ